METVVEVIATLTGAFVWGVFASLLVDDDE